MNLSTHFTLQEALFSSTADRLGIDNSNPPQWIVNNARVSAQMMESIRGLIGLPLHIDSWIRCLMLNRALKSKDSSQHIRGEAIDFICPAYGSPLAIARLIEQNVKIIDFDELIYEHNWVHVSRATGVRATQRNKVLTLMPDGEYAEGLLDK